MRPNAGEAIFIVALRHLDSEREIVVLKFRRGHFHAFTPSAIAGKSDVDIHFSRHKSGRNHMVVRRRVGRKWLEDKWPRLQGGPEATMRHQTQSDRQPTDAFRSAEMIGAYNIMAGQFLQLEPIGTAVGEMVMLDARSEGFRDDFTGVRLYLVEPHRENTIPANDYAGPRILHIIKKTTPWIAVELFQLKYT
jgi:hypothetical protein